MKIFNKTNILIVEDDAEMREELKDILSEEGYEIISVGTYALAKEELKEKFYNIVLLDLNLPDGTGLELLKEITRINKEIMVIIFTGFASLESSISALNNGAFAYIQKPLNLNEVKISIKKALHIQKLSFDNKNLLNRLKELSLTDTHTEVYNYRYLMERLTLELKRAKRYKFPISIIMLDIDYFKSINDVYGHPYGDIILKEFVQYLKGFVRSSDTVTRYGGEEFVILLPHANKEDTVIFGKRLLNAIRSHIFDPEGKRLRLKISMGIANLPEDGGHIDTASDLLNLADKMLLNAKETGGNRISSFKSINKKNVGDIAEKCEKENIDKIRKKLFKMESRVNQTLVESIYAIVKKIEDKGYGPSAHAEDMVSIVTKIGKKLNMSDKEIENLQHAAVLHDIGKIGISDDILRKRKNLTKKEYKIIKQHPQIAAEIIGPIHFFKELIPIIRFHHERFDGGGYSASLKGNEIPLGARIIAIIDVYQALVSDRPYRKAYSKKSALKIIQEGSGSQFDPEIVEAFMTVIKSRL